MIQASSDLGTKNSEHAEQPYPPSWVDRLMTRIERLPGPTWVFYVILTGAIILVAHAIRWLGGSVMVGEVDPARVAEAPLVVSFLALIHYLNTIAKRSLSDFRPAMDVSDLEYARLDYELTTMPARVGFLTAGVGMLIGILSAYGDPVSWGISANTSPFVSIYAYMIAAIVMATGAVFVVHTVRQLRLVNHIHQGANKFSLFKGAPL